jgi:hypothetical protein
MKGRLASSWPVYMATAMTAAALLITARSCGDIADKRRQIENRRAQWNTLQELKAGEHTRQTAIARTLASAPEGAPNLADMLRAHLPGAQPDIQTRASTEIDGRVLEHYDVRLEDVESALLAGFLEACATAQPPLRVVTISVSPSRRGSSERLQVQLELIGLR